MHMLENNKPVQTIALVLDSWAINDFYDVGNNNLVKLLHNYFSINNVILDPLFF